MIGTSRTRSLRWVRQIERQSNGEVFPTIARPDSIPRGGHRVAAAGTNAADLFPRPDAEVHLCRTGCGRGPDRLPGGRCLPRAAGMGAGTDDGRVGRHNQPGRTAPPVRGAPGLGLAVGVRRRFRGTVATSGVPVAARPRDVQAHVRLRAQDEPQPAGAGDLRAGCQHGPAALRHVEGTGAACGRLVPVRISGGVVAGHPRLSAESIRCLRTTWCPAWWPWRGCRPG